MKIDYSCMCTDRKYIIFSAMLNDIHMIFIRKVTRLCLYISSEKYFMKILTEISNAAVVISGRKYVISELSLVSNYDNLFCIIFHVAYVIVSDDIS